MPSISFITANYVGRALNYPGGAVSDWGKFDRATREIASSEHFSAVARDAAMAGFDAIDIWEAHCDWRKQVSEDHLEQIKGACSQFDLTITSYAGGVVETDPQEWERMLKFVKQLGAPMVAGGVWGTAAKDVWPKIDEMCGRIGLQYAFENHPEKSAAEILEKIDHGRWKNVGVALDTGWCGTHGLDALEAAKALREKLFIVHLKDVLAAGGHETCGLGEGIVPVEKVVRYLTQSGWSGTFCIEHEPFDRDPMPEAMESLQRVKQWMH